MTLREDSDPPSAGHPLPGPSDDIGPSRALLLAQGLETCLRAEQRQPGSAETVIGAQPAWAQAELRSLVALAGAVRQAADAGAMPHQARAATRARLLAAIGAPSSDVVNLSSARVALVPPAARGHHRGQRGWLMRGSAGLFAAALGVVATVNASANALPGEPLYGIKQAQEEIAIRLAADDQARALALLRSADARLDEMDRLLRQGRTDEAARATRRYDQDVERATSTFIVTVERPRRESSADEPIDNRLSQQQQQLQTLLQSAPEPARADLRNALVATERVRALVADPRPLEQALGRAETRSASGPATTAAVAAEAPFATPLPTHPPVMGGGSDERGPTRPADSAAADERNDDVLAAAPRRRSGRDDATSSASGRGGEPSSERGSGNETSVVVSVQANRPADGDSDDRDRRASDPRAEHAIVEPPTKAVAGQRGRPGRAQDGRTAGGELRVDDAPPGPPVPAAAEAVIQIGTGSPDGSEHGRPEPTEAQQGDGSRRDGRGGQVADGGRRDAPAKSGDARASGRQADDDAGAAPTTVRSGSQDGGPRQARAADGLPSQTVVARPNSTQSSGAANAGRGQNGAASGRAQSNDDGPVTQSSSDATARRIPTPTPGAAPAQQRRADTSSNDAPRVSGRDGGSSSSSSSSSGRDGGSSGGR